MPATTDVRKAGEAALEQGRATLALTAAEARKPLYASVGVADVAVARLRELRGTVEGAAGLVAGRLGSRAGEVYDELSARGERLVTSIRRQPETEQAVSAARRTAGAASRTRRSAKSGTKATSRSASATAKSAGTTGRAAARAAKGAAETAG